jgi:hypothetical protein
MTAGKGKDGAGDADLRIDGDEPKDDRLLCDVGGGFMNCGSVCGVPGTDGAGEAARKVLSAKDDVRGTRSGGAGLLLDILLRAGKSILLIL